MEQVKGKGNNVVGIIVSLIIGLIIGGVSIYFLTNKGIITINKVNSSDSNKLSSDKVNSNDSSDITTDESTLESEDITYPTSYTTSNCLNCGSDASFVDVQISTDIVHDNYMSIKESLDEQSFVLTINHDKAFYGKTGTKEFNIPINPDEVSQYAYGSTYQASGNGIFVFVMKDGTIKYILEKTVVDDNPTIVVPEDVSNVTRIVTGHYSIDPIGSYVSTSVQRSDGDFYSLAAMIQ